MNIGIAILVLTGLGIIFGVGLAIAAKKFCVVNDPRLEKIYERLPGVNCGGCGKPGCMAFAEALIAGTCMAEGCVVMNQSAKESVAKILGHDLKTSVKKVSVLHCNGGSKRVKDKFKYEGVRDCIAANLVMGGPKECFYGCIGLGSCVKTCRFGAITLNEFNLPVINENKCTACNACVLTCPKKLFSLVPFTKKYAVRCKSLDLGKDVYKVCSVGCIACHKCEKACPVSAIKVTDNLSVIDYHLCVNHGECFKACPVKTIGEKVDKAWIEKQ